MGVLLLVKSNFQKNFWRILAIFVFIVLAALLLNMLLVITTDYRQNFRDTKAKLNGEDVLHVYSADYNTVKFKNHLHSFLDDDDRIYQYEVTRGFLMTSTAKLGSGVIAPGFIVTKKSDIDNKQIGQCEIVSDAGGSGVYLPYIFSLDDNYKIGDNFHLESNKITLDTTVIGFFNNLMLGEYTSGGCLIVLTDDEYSRVVPKQQNATILSITLNDGVDAAVFDTDLSLHVLKYSSNCRHNGRTADEMEQVRYLTQTVLVALIYLAVALVLLVALVIVTSDILGSISSGISQIGALAAVGYKTWQFILSYIVQYFVVSLVATVVGVTLSYTVLNPLTALLTEQTGLPYIVHFLPWQAVTTGVIISFLVVAVTVLATLRLHKINPVVAMRTGAAREKARRDIFPLHKSKMHVNATLAFKTTVNNIGQGITLFVTMLGLSFALVFCAVLYQNALVSMDPMKEIVNGQMANVAVSIKKEYSDAVLQLMKEDERTLNAYKQDGANIFHVGGSSVTCLYAEDFSGIENHNTCYKGRLPRNSEEVAININYAKKYNLQIGDKITLVRAQDPCEYTICGLTQMGAHLGKEMYLTYEGYGRINNYANMRVCAIVKEGTDIDQYVADLYAKSPYPPNSYVNFDKLNQTYIQVYTGAMKIIVSVILVMCLGIIAFVLGLLVKSIIRKKKLDYGILKALGYTNSQLTLQTGLAMMPVLIVSTIIGITASIFLINPVISALLRPMGIIYWAFKVPVWLCIVGGIALLALSFGFSCLMSLQVRKLSPHKLLLSE